MTEFKNSKMREWADREFNNGKMREWTGDRFKNGRLENGWMREF